MLLISEPGLYELIIRSDKPKARPFMRWITHDVLPSIRKQGFYSEGRRKPTRWGWQPIRKVIQERGFSAKDFVQSANALDMPGVSHFTEGNFAAWSYGACLPAECLVKRAEALLNAPAHELFTDIVLANYRDRGPGKRHLKTVI
jgi:hypothetical protein